MTENDLAPSVTSDGESPADEPKSRKRRRLRTVLLALAVVVVVLLGVGVMYYRDVPVPVSPSQGESTTFTYSDGETLVARYGENHRILVDSYEEMPETVVFSTLMLEDRDFFDHNGVTFSGAVRSLFGSDSDDASTLTQKYVSILAELPDGGSGARAAVMAHKAEREYRKEEILREYLNLNSYGRGAFGVATAAQVWFGKPLADLTWEEAMLIAMQPGSADGLYDPATDPESSAPEDRWNEGMDALVDDGHIDQAYRDAAQFPEPLEHVANVGTWVGDTPTGFITNPDDGYVYDELEDRYGLTREQLYGSSEGTGGYTVALTLDQDVQAASEETGSRGALKVVTDGNGAFLNENGDVVESRGDAAPYVDEDGFFEYENSNEQATLHEFPASMTSASVSIDPATGAVLGYYGGDNGTGTDRAGIDRPHTPSALFYMITAATAIKNGASIESMWDGSSPREFDSLEGVGDGTITNGGRVEETHETLTDAVRRSNPVSMYAIAEKYGATAILETAVDMGLRTLVQTDSGTEVTYRFHKEEDGSTSYSRHGIIENDDGSYVTDFNGNIDMFAPLDGVESDGSPVRTVLDPDVANEPFYFHLGFGQYRTAVRDMAAVYATIANNGVHQETHFVAEVLDRNGNVVEPVRELNRTQALDEAIARDLQFVGGAINADESDGLDRDFFGKTATWEAFGTADDGSSYPSGSNSTAWYAGAVPQLSTAVWVGNATSESAPIFGPDGGTEGAFAATISYPVWQDLMTAVLDAKDWEALEWAGPVVVGEAITDDIDR